MKKPAWIKVSQQFEEMGVYKDIVDFAGIEKEDGVIVDLGTGNGNLLAELYNRYPKSILFGTDISPDILKYANRNLSKRGIPSRFYPTYLYTLSTEIIKGEFVDWGLKQYPTNIDLNEVVLIEDNYTYSGMPMFLATTLKGTLADKAFFSFQGLTKSPMQSLDLTLPVSVPVMLNDDGEFIFYERVVYDSKDRKITSKDFDNYVHTLEERLGLRSVKAEFDDSEFARKVDEISYDNITTTFGYFDGTVLKFSKDDPNIVMGIVKVRMKLK